MEGSTVTNKFEIDAERALETLNVLTAKAEKLMGLLKEIEAFGEDLDETIAMAESTVDTMRKAQSQKIVWAISIGDLRQILAAPQDAFSPEVIDFIREGLTGIIGNVQVEPEQVKGKIIGLAGKN